MICPTFLFIPSSWMSSGFYEKRAIFGRCKTENCANLDVTKVSKFWKLCYDGYRDKLEFVEVFYV